MDPDPDPGGPKHTDPDSDPQYWFQESIISGWPYFCPAPWSSTLIPMTCNSATSQWKAVSTPIDKKKIFSIMYSMA
jgi:hypothetical protein